MSTSTKHRLLNIDYKYDKPLIQKRKKDNCKLKQTYINQYRKWLVVGEQGCVCKACKLFIKAADLPTKVGNFLTVPWTGYSRAKDLERHTETDYHINAVKTMEEFEQRVITRQKKPIDEDMDKSKEEQREISEKRLNAIFRAIIFCGRQGIALRGHRNESANFLEVVSSDCVPGDVNRGNFLQLLDFRREAGDRSIDHAAHQKALYTSPAIQDEITNMIGDHIIQHIVTEVDRSRFFTIIADETRDSSNKEQLCIAVRFVDGKSTEKFLSFVKLESLRGESSSGLYCMFSNLLPFVVF